jgi:hypothetical protein
LGQQPEHGCLHAGGYGPVKEGRGLCEDFPRMIVPAPLQVLPGG